MPPTPNPLINNLYYADAYIIEGKGCLILGNGKSKMGEIATNLNRDDEIGQDSICLTRDGSYLYAHYDVEFVLSASYNPKREPIHHMVLCLDQERTKQIPETHRHMGHSVEYDLFVGMSDYFITFTPPNGNFELIQTIGQANFDEYTSPEKRRLRFIQLTSNVPGMEYLVLPWMDDVRYKAAALQQYMKELP
jgi:hypothetical protein